jgi:hypothetical protein
MLKRSGRAVKPDTIGPQASNPVAHYAGGRPVGGFFSHTAGITLEIAIPALLSLPIRFFSCGFGVPAS